jgi:steroid delta-isomerase-like uncharacterized protein
VSRAAPQEMDLLLKEFVEAFNAHDAGRVAALHAPEYEGTDVGQASSYRGPEGAARRIASYVRAFPDLTLSCDEALVQGDRAALFWTVRGTHEGKLMNIPPTGRRVEVRGVSLLTVKNGKIARALYIWDVAGLLRGFRLLPDL